MTDTNEAEVLRAEIDRTRAALGETVEALAAKTNVKARAQEAAGRVVASVKETTSGVVDDVKGALGGGGKALASTSTGVSTDTAVPGSIRRTVALGAAVGAVVALLIWLRRSRRR